MKVQRDAVTCRRSQRHAAGITTAHAQLQHLKENSLTACVMTRQRKRRRDETSEQWHLTETSTKTGLKQPRNNTLHSVSSTRAETTCEAERSDKQLVVSSQTPTRRNSKEPRQTSFETERTGEAQVICGSEEAPRLPEAKNRLQTTKKSRKTSHPSEGSAKVKVMSGSKKSKEPPEKTRTRGGKSTDRLKICPETKNTREMSASQISEARTQARKTKEPRQIESHSKNIVETQTVSGSKISEKQSVETETGTKSENEPKQTSSESANTAKDQIWTETVVGGTSRPRERVNQTTTDDEVKRVCSEDRDESDSPVSKTDSASTALTSFDVVKPAVRSLRSSLSDKPDCEPIQSLPASQDRLDSAHNSETRSTEQVTSKTTKDVCDAKRQETGRHAPTNLPRSLDDAVVLAVTCGSSQAELVLSRLESGSRGACVRLEDGSWLTPNEFQLISGRGNAKDWKRSIRHHGQSLKWLVEQGLLSLASPPLCICQHCDVPVSEVRLSNSSDVACYCTVLRRLCTNTVCFSSETHAQAVVRGCSGVSNKKVSYRKQIAHHHLWFILQKYPSHHI